MNRTYVCKECGAEKKYQYGNANLFCSIACQQTAAFNAVIANWANVAPGKKCN